MGEDSKNVHRAPDTAQRAVIERLRTALEDGRAWATSLVEAMATWTTPVELFRGRRYKYFVDGEAFDWLLLAERLCQAVGGLIPQQERDDLLFSGQLPSSFDTSRFRHLLGVEKYRGYLNHFYGVTVEETLQLATELEAYKRHVSNGIHYKQDFTDEAHIKIYGASRSELLTAFREERGFTARRSIGLGESNEFTYWLFKYRMKVSDRAKIASDTKKGLRQLERMRGPSHASVYPADASVLDVNLFDGVARHSGKVLKNPIEPSA